jgi:hypothetical protein
MLGKIWSLYTHFGKNKVIFALALVGQNWAVLVSAHVGQNRAILVLVHVFAKFDHFNIRPC